MDLAKLIFIALIGQLVACSKAEFTSGEYQIKQAEGLAAQAAEPEEAPLNEDNPEIREAVLSKVFTAPNQSPVITSTPIDAHTYYPPPEDLITLQAEVRDFMDSHPDFETYTSAIPIPGLVAPLLGKEGSPIFAGLDGEFISNALTFSQWYQDLPGLNMKVPLSLDLKKIPGSNIYQYYNNNFFPIDNLGFGNQGRIHNFHFTLQLSTTFTYAGGETFTFIGDDDVWVFINKALAVDLGGVHPEAAKSVNLDSLGLQVGKTYPFDLFYAERHTTASHFKVETTITLNSDNQAYEYQVRAEDPEGDVLVYSLEVAPIGMTIDPASGLISWLPGAENIGEHQVIIRVEDQVQGSDIQEFILVVVEDDKVTS